MQYLCELAFVLVCVCAHTVCAHARMLEVRGQLSEDSCQGSSTLFLSMVSLVSAYDPGNSPVSISNLAIRELGLKI